GRRTGAHRRASAPRLPHPRFEAIGERLPGPGDLWSQGALPGAEDHRGDHVGTPGPMEVAPAGHGCRLGDLDPRGPSLRTHRAGADGDQLVRSLRALRTSWSLWEAAYSACSRAWGSYPSSGVQE